MRRWSSIMWDEASSFHVKTHTSMTRLGIMKGIEEGTLKCDSLWKMTEIVGTIAIGRGSGIVELLKHSIIL